MQGQYSMSQLSYWYHLARMSYTDGRVTSDLAESKNRIVFGVRDQEAKVRIEEALLRLGIPRGAVEIIIDPRPIVFGSHDLESQFDPLVGGARIEVREQGSIPY